MSTKLDEYRKRYAEWVEWLNGSDVHSVSSQVHTLNHDSAILRVVLRAVELSPQDDYGRSTINPWFVDWERRSPDRRMWAAWKLPLLQEHHPSPLRSLC